MSIFPDEVPDVAVVPVGGPPDAAVECVGDAVERELGVTVTVFDTQSGPDPDHDDVAVDGGEVLGRTAEPVTDDFDLAVGVTDASLRVADRVGVFGASSAGGNVSVISTAHVIDDAPLDDEERARMEKLALHAIGRLFGFESHDGCVMQSADVVPELDDRPRTFCDDCASRLRDPETAPEPPEWHAVTKELEQFRTAKRWSEGDVRVTEYPVYALGWLVDALSRARSRLPTVAGVPRPVRAFVHESYRTVHFWVLVFTYLLVYALVVVGGLGGYGTVVGAEPSNVLTWTIAVVGLPTAYVVHLLLRGVASGLFRGAIEGTRDGLRAEE